MKALSCSLASNTNICNWPFDVDTKRDIIQILWRADVKGGYGKLANSAVDPYLGYYSEQCRLALHDRGKHVSVRTHQDIFDIVKLLRESHSRESIKDQIRFLSPAENISPEHDALDGSINLAARLLVMIELGSLEYGVSCQSRLVWREDSLQSFIAQQFEPPKLLGKETAKLEKSFNARNLERVSGMQIVWTSNLVDHLRVLDDDKGVAIFHHASFLKSQRNRYDRRFTSRFRTQVLEHGANSLQ